MGNETLYNGRIKETNDTKYEAHIGCIVTFSARWSIRKKSKIGHLKNERLI